MQPRTVSTQKTKTMLRTITVVLMTNPSRGSAFYFRRRDGEHYDRVFNRCRDIPDLPSLRKPPDRLARY
jgi:hypothetical protein